MITVSNVTKRYGQSTIIDNLCFDVRPNSICAIVGPTACGKSTLLNIIGGLDPLDSGSISDVPNSSIGYMLQDSLLLPWRTLEENVTLGTEIRKNTKPNVETVQLYLENVELWTDRLKYPAEASGGMMQRAAFVRTLLLQTELLLLDEPFSSLDFDIKLKVQRFLLKLQSESRSTILWVTHDIEDAIAISDKIIVLSNKPSEVKAVIDVDLGSATRKPIEARRTPRFREIFSDILNHLKYLDNSYAD